MNEHRVPMLGAALRRRVDPARSSDPKVREVVGALATLEIAPAPSPQFRAELRAQLVAVTPRLVAEGEASAASPARGENRAASRPSRARRFRFATPLIAAACVLVAFALLLGGAVLLSRRALPGDALYGIKRASENTQYDITGGNVAKGKLKLDFAARRIAEVRALLPSGPATPGTRISPDTARLVRETLASADGDVQAASRLLATSAVGRDDAAPLQVVTSWTPGQVGALNGIIASTPSGTLRGSAVQTRAVLLAAQHRADALRADLGCACLRAAGTDAYGPRPCTGGCAASARKLPAGRHPAGHRPGRHRSLRPGSPASRPVVRPHASSVSRPTIGAPPAAGPPAGRPTTGPQHSGGSQPPVAGLLPSPSLPLPLPAVPVGTPGSTQLPVALNTCGVTASVGSIRVGVGGC